MYRTYENIVLLIFSWFFFVFFFSQIAGPENEHYIFSLLYTYKKIPSYTIYKSITQCVIKKKSMVNSQANTLNVYMCVHQMRWQVEDYATQI